LKALVTGATGFIGGALTRRLLADGWHVRVLVRDPVRAEALKAGGAEPMEGNVEAPDSLARACRGVDAVFHAAAGVDLVKPDRDALLRTNVDGTRNILAAAMAARVDRVVHFSSVAALGRTRPQADESMFHDGNYNGPYEESKHKAEQVAFEFAHQGLNVVQVLPCVTIGPGDPKSGGFILRYLHRRIPAVPDVDGTASFVHIDDLIEGVLLAFEKGRAGDRYVFSQVTWTTTQVLLELEIASGVPPPRRIPLWAALAGAAFEEARAALLRRPPVVSRSAVRLAARRFGYSSAKARRELGWSPAEFRERFRSVVHHWQQEVARGAA
jgi:dihydroflavonol-4-reductase